MECQVQTSKVERRRSRRRVPRPGFTLTELLVVMMILAILSGLALAALSGAVNDARATRTKTVINKIDSLIQERWEGYRTRPVPLTRLQGASPPAVAAMRLTGLRELMRFELPERISDLCTDAELTDLVADNDLDAIASTTTARSSVLTALPSAACAYKRLAARNIATSGKAWTDNSQGAECLYLILSVIKDGDKSGLDFFSTSEVGDVDGDGFKEILDGWGRPIEFLRWAPGYTRELPGPDFKWGVAGTDDNGNSVTDDIDEFYWSGSDDVTWNFTTQSRDSRVAPDPFDPLKVDSRWANVDPGTRPFALHPLIFSGGPDRSYDIHIGSVDYAITVPPSDPYYLLTTGPLIGTPAESPNDSDNDILADNITNHDNTAQ